MLISPKFEFVKIQRELIETRNSLIQTHDMVIKLQRDVEELKAMASRLTPHV